MEEVRHPGLYGRGGALFTENLTPGRSVYGEERVDEAGREFRRFDPKRSKLAAFVINGGQSWPFERTRALLYLGASHGTTASHLSDVLPRARIHLIEKSPRSFSSLLALAGSRTNLYPWLADAQLPERYRAQVGEVEVLYQDVAQRNQVEVLLENARACLKPHGHAILQLKTRSITQSESPRAVLKFAQRTLEDNGLEVLESVDLTPFSRGHFTLVLQAHG